jgi:hypothetical protein
MTIRNEQIAAALDQIVPSFRNERGNWQHVLHEAQVVASEPPTKVTRGHRWAVLLASTVIVGALAIVPALAVGNGWWFIGEGKPRPVTEVMVITTGEASGRTWYLVAFLSDEKGVCVGVSGAPEERAGTLACGAAIRGVPGPTSDNEPEHWVGFASGGLPEGDSFAFGPAASDVARVEIELANGATVTAETVAAPVVSDIPGRFYVLKLPPRAIVLSVDARDASGALLERLPVQVR